MLTMSRPTSQFSKDAPALQPAVYIVDDDQAMRKSLRWLVETLGVPVKTFHCAVSFLDAYDPNQPGCLILDVIMPGMSGLDLLREMNERHIDIPVIVLTGYGDVPTAVRALKNGAVEFLEKPPNDETLLEHIRKALALDSRRRRERGILEIVRERMAKLTPREYQILQLVIDGLSSKEIAVRLSVSFKTVEAHRAKIMRKMEAESVAQLVRMVVSAKSLGGDHDRPPSRRDSSS
jgi:two-component system, LuxR family, response regulator FixJ